MGVRGAGEAPAARGGSTGTWLGHPQRRYAREPLAARAPPQPRGWTPTGIARRSSRRPVCGSSPRGRGTRLPDDLGARPPRFIPAWAGNTRPRQVDARSTSVHPRVGGEHWASLRRSWSINGSSPRGRGTPHLLDRHVSHRRFIPAWAGNTAHVGSSDRLSTVHPRVGGEHLHRPSEIDERTGSSPRGRGTRPSGE